MTVLIARNEDVELSRCEVDRQVITIGRAPNNDFCIRDKSLSRSHARLERQSDGYRVRDLGSANGTSLNGKKLDGPVLARDGDELELGNVTVRLQADGAAPEPVVSRRRSSAVLIVTGDDGQRSSFALMSDAIILGRSDDADVSLPSKKISRRHAKLQRAGGFFILADLGSQNGTWVRKRRLDRPQRMSPGDSFYIEPYTLELDEREVELPDEQPVAGKEQRTAFFLSPDELEGVEPIVARTGQIEAPDDEVFEEESVMGYAPKPTDVLAGPTSGHGTARVLLVSGETIEHRMISPIATVGDTSDCDVVVPAGALPTGPCLVLVAADGGRLAVVRLGHGPVLVVDGFERDTALLDRGDVAVLGPLEIHWQ
jgi:pSer/pThr/pTyr-binding forkhead associated (FHA) protein